MNDRYDYTERVFDRYEHDIREFKNRIDQLEEENAKLQKELDFTRQFIIDNDMQWALLSEYDKLQKARASDADK